MYCLFGRGFESLLLHNNLNNLPEKEIIFFAQNFTPFPQDSFTAVQIEFFGFSQTHKKIPPESEEFTVFQTS